MSAKTSRLSRLVLAAAVATAGLAGSLAVGNSAHAVGTSSVNGQITRSEVLARAQSWVDEGVPYSQDGSHPYTDSNGSYRSDCSGYVSMAWHLGSSLTTQTLRGVSTQLNSFDDLKPGDMLDRYDNGNYNIHVVLFAGWADSAHTTANVYAESTWGTNASRKTYSRSYLNSADFRPWRYNNIVDGTTGSYPDPATLPTGTLVKSPNNPTVKLIINGAGLAVAGSDVAPDGYNMGAVVTVDDAKFWALPSSLPSGTVVHDQSGTSNNRYVIVGGAALSIAGSEWTADGYNTAPDMGVPTSWLQQALQNTLPAGMVVHDQSGTSNNRYVMVNGAALLITGAEWTADGYNAGSDTGVPGTWLQAAAAKTPPTGTVLMDQSGLDNNRYVMVNGAAVHISGAEWTADGYNTQALMGVPGTWLAGSVNSTVADGTLVKGRGGADPSVYVMANGSALPLTNAEYTQVFASAPVTGVPETWEAAQVARPLKNGTVIKNASGADPSVYVMAGGKAVPLSGADFTGLGYDKQPLRGVPGTWEAAAVAKTAPADGTLLKSSDTTTVWQVVNGGSKKAAAAGSYNAADVVAVPTALTTQLPTVTQ
ncbi:PAS domain-containing protein [Kitasatospora cineracea]